MTTEKKMEGARLVKGSKRLNCPECGSEMMHAEKTEEVRYKGVAATTLTNGWWCDACGEGILSSSGLKSSEAAFLSLKAKIDSLAES